MCNAIAHRPRAQNSYCSYLSHLSLLETLKSTKKQVERSAEKRSAKFRSAKVRLAEKRSAGFKADARPCVLQKFSLAELSLAAS
jgi:hypothetical protein